MYTKLARFLVSVLIVQLIAGPAMAEDYRSQFGRPMINSDSGTSFRKSDSGDQKGILSPAEQMLQGQDMQNKMGIVDPTGMLVNYQVHILGEVENPGTYKVVASERLSEAIAKAGGIEPQGSQRNVELRRNGEPTHKIDLMKFQLFGDLSNNPYLLDNDVIFVPLKKITIQVVGAVNRPRDYEIKSEKTLKDVIDLAGGVTVGAAMNSPVRVIRFTDSQKQVIEVAPNESDESAFLIQNGDVIVMPHKITEKNKFDYDIPKLPGDNIFYPSFEDRVFILGGVVSPGAYPFNPYYSLPQYLSIAGGTTKMATGKISLLSPDGKSNKITKKNRDTTVINPGDTIVIDERRIAPEGWIAIFMSIASFGLSATATTLALLDRK